MEMQEAKIQELVAKLKSELIGVNYILRSKESADYSKEAKLAISKVRVNLDFAINRINSHLDASEALVECKKSIESARDYCPPGKTLPFHDCMVLLDKASKLMAPKVLEQQEKNAGLRTSH